jgi:creatinine amidohydrolase
METSIGLHLFPDLMAPLTQADEGRVRASRFKALNEGWVKITRPWDKLTTNSGVGDPRGGTAEKGRRYIDAVVEKLAPFLVEFANAEMDDLFPYLP